MKRLVSMVLSVVMGISLLPISMPTVLAKVNTIEPMVSLGDYHSAALKSDGSAWFWGNNSNGQIGDGTNTTVKTPKKIMDDVVYIALGSQHSAVIKKDGSLWMWGNNDVGQIGDGTTIDVKTPKKILDDVVDVSLGTEHSAAIKKDGSLWMWGGHNVYSELGNAEYNNITIPQYITNGVKMVSVGTFHSTYVTNDGYLWLTGNLGSVSCQSPTKQLSNVKKISSAVYASIAIRNDNTLWACGYNYNRMNLNGVSYDDKEYTKIMDNIADAAFGSVNGAAIKADGSLWIWGENQYGQIGNGNISKDSIIQPTKILTNVEYIDINSSHMAAIKTDGSLWMWGRNNYGQLGNGEKENSCIPIKIMNLNAGLVVEGESSVQNNKETTLKAIRYDENGNIAPEGGITWSCSNESVAQISPWGNNVTVKGLKGGKATITATHTESGQKADFEIEVVSYVMTLAGGYTVMLDEELEINYAVKQGEEYVHNHLDIKWEIESKDGNNAIKIISDKDNAYTRALTIKGINEGECDLVAKVDGAELGRTKIEVLGNLADTINDETIIRAKYLVNNSQYKYYKNYNSVHGMFADEMDLTPSIVKYSLDNYLSVFYKSIYKGKAPDEVTATEFYECVLVKLLNDDENVKVFGKVGDVMSDYILKYGKKIAEKGTKIDDANKKQLKEICEGLCGDGLENVGFIDTLLISGKSIETYFEEYAKIYQMASCTNEQIKAIKLIKNSTSDKALKTACDNVIKSIEKAQADTAKYAVSSGATKTAEQLSEYAFEKMVGALEKFSPALAAFDLVKEITSPINNILFQADDIESDTIDLYALIVIENALKDAMESAEKTFNSNPTAEKAENLMAAADFYKNVQLYGCDICDSLLENYGEAKRNQGIAWDTLVIIMKNVVNREVKMSDVFNALFGNVDAETLDNRKTLSDIRKLIDSADFYGSEGTDVAEFIREVKSTTPSEWAKPEIKKATDYGFLPDYMQNNYQNNITRAEFCTILTWMIEEKTGKGIDQLIEEKGTPIKSPFEDTYYEYADYMCKLGIVNGVSATEFNPLGEITREQAATMLMRTADVLGYDTSYNTSVESGVSSWAIEGVGFVTENGIMNGTGNGFEPQGKYTKEQAIATFVRMYDNLK